MKAGRIFLIAVMAGALGALGCGDDGGGGTAGSGGSGTAGTGGSGTAGTGGGNGAPVSTCDAVCGDSPCGDADEPDCEENCAALEPSYATDDCGGLMQDFLECAEPGCGPLDFWNGVDLQIAWDACAKPE